MDTNAVIDQLLKRGSSSSFGYGLSTADVYVKRFVEASSDETLKRFGVSSKGDVLKRSAGTLTYSVEEMQSSDVVVVEKATSLSAMNPILKKLSVPDSFMSDAKNVERAEKLLRNAALAFKHTVTESVEDRDSDLLESKGAMLDPLAPLLLHHMHTLTVGGVLTQLEQTEQKLTAATVLLDLNAETSDAAKLIDAGVFRFSHGFRPLEWEERRKTSSGQPGFRFTKYEIMEVSLVAVPSNTKAEMEIVETVKLTSDLFKGYQSDLLSKRTKVYAGVDVGEFERSLPASGDTPKSWTKATAPVGFTPENERLEPSRLEFDWVSRFLGCEIKDLVVIDSHVSSLDRPSFMVAEERILATRGLEEKDHRRLTYDGKESPPYYSVAQCNSSEHIRYMSEGLAFYKNTNGDALVIKHEPGWNCTWVTTYAVNEFGEKFVKDCNDWVSEHHFLKGEAFSLGGDFLGREGTVQGDIFLNQKNRKSLERVIKLVNKDKFTPRGQLFIGPPGTGKTLSIRAIKNETDKTFIWVTSKDFDVLTAFAMAKKFAPSVLVFEDCDDCFTRWCIDVFKTEMDGVDENKSVLTIIATNFPERLPEALTDRPGRFHDTLEYECPDKLVRTQMLKAWAPGLDEKDVPEVVEKTDGYSGAHMWELVTFAKTLSEEDNTLDVKSSIRGAIDKIDEMRKLLSSVRRGSYHRSPDFTSKAVLVSRKGAGQGLSKLVEEPDVSEGEVDSKPSESDVQAVIKAVYDELSTIAGMDEVPEEATKMCKGCMSQLEKLIDPDAEMSAKAISFEEAALVVLAHPALEEAAKLVASIRTSVDVAELDKKAESYRQLVSAAG